MPAKTKTRLPRVPADKHFLSRFKYVILTVANDNPQTLNHLAEAGLRAGFSIGSLGANIRASARDLLDEGFIAHDDEAGVYITTDEGREAIRRTREFYARQSF